MTAPKSQLTSALLIAIAAVELSTPAQTSNALQVSNLTASSNGWRLAWPQLTAGTAYTVQFQDTLKDGIWRLPAFETPFPIPTNQWTDPSTNPTRFYRVIGVPKATRGKLRSVGLSN